MVFDEGPAAILSMDVDETAASVDSFAAGDGDAWRRLYEEWQRVGGAMVDALMRPFPPVGPALRLAAKLRTPRHLLDFARFALLPVRTMVEERRWMTHADFTETIGLCQFLPGPNIGNASIVLGKRWFGLAGSIVAFLGLMALPFIWVLALFIFYSDFSSIAAVRSVVIGVGAAGAGLFMGTAIKLGRPLAKKPAALVLIAACFLCVAIARISLLIVVPVGLAVAVVAARRKWL